MTLRRGIADLELQFDLIRCCFWFAFFCYRCPKPRNVNMSSKLLKKQLRTFVNQEKAESSTSRKLLPSKVVSGTFKVSRDGRKKKRQMLQLQTKSSSYTQQRLAIESDNMKHNLYVFNRSNQPTEHQLEVAQLLLPKKVPNMIWFSPIILHPCHLQTENVTLFVTFRKQLVEESAAIRMSNSINRECIERCAN